MKHYTKHNLSEVRGPITVVSGNTSGNSGFIGVHYLIRARWRIYVGQTSGEIFSWVLHFSDISGGNWKFCWSLVGMKAGIA